MVDPKKVFALLSKQRAAKRRAALEAAKDIFFKMRAVQMQRPALDGVVIPAPPLERPHV